MKIPPFVRRPLEKAALKLLADAPITGAQINTNPPLVWHGDGAINTKRPREPMPGFLFIGDATYLNAEKVVRIEPFEPPDLWAPPLGTPIWRSQIIMEGSSSERTLSKLHPSDIIYHWKEPQR